MLFLTGVKYNSRVCLNRTRYFCTNELMSLKISLPWEIPPAPGGLRDVCSDVALPSNHGCTTVTISPLLPSHTGGELNESDSFRESSGSASRCPLSSLRSERPRATQAFCRQSTTAIRHGSESEYIIVTFIVGSVGPGIENKYY